MHFDENLLNKYNNLNYIFKHFEYYGDNSLSFFSKFENIYMILFLLNIFCIQYKMNTMGVRAKPHTKQIYIIFFQIWLHRSLKKKIKITH